MSRFFSTPLIRKPHLRLNPSITPRHHSSKTHKSQLIELDLDSSASPSPSSEEGVQVISGGVHKLEEVIQSIIVRRTAPDWLPFLPGHSYWVPPSNGGLHSRKLIEVVGKVSAAPLSRRMGLTNDQRMALGSNRGWPSSRFFIEDTSPPHPVPMEMEVEVKIYDSPEATNEYSSEDEED